MATQPAPLKRADLLKRLRANVVDTPCSDPVIDRLTKEVAKLFHEAADYIERHEPEHGEVVALLNAVEPRHHGIEIRDVNGRNWFDVRDEVVASLCATGRRSDG